MFPRLRMLVFVSGVVWRFALRWELWAAANRGRGRRLGCHPCCFHRIIWHESEDLVALVAKSVELQHASRARARPVIAAAVITRRRSLPGAPRRPATHLCRVLHVVAVPQARRDAHAGHTGAQAGARGHEGRCEG